jgi:hypothetical protein
VYMRTRPVMAIGGVRGVLVCRVWHVCGGRVGSTRKRIARVSAWVVPVCS